MKDFINNFFVKIFVLPVSHNIGKKIVSNSRGIRYSKQSNDIIKKNNPKKYLYIFLDLEYLTRKNKDIDQNKILVKYAVNKYGPVRIELAKKGKGEINKKI